MKVLFVLYKISKHILVNMEAGTKLSIVSEVFVLSCRLSFRLIYIFSYNLFQFCGHTWILTNTIVRFLMFGQGKEED